MLDGLLGLREGEKKQPTDGVVAPADAQPPAAAVDSAPASEIASGGDGVVFQWTETRQNESRLDYASIWLIQCVSS